MDSKNIYNKCLYVYINVYELMLNKRNKIYKNNISCKNFPKTFIFQELKK